jgi:hypothetical protein
MKASDILGRIIAQVSSGRWIITVTAAICLMWLTKTLCFLMEQGIIELEASTYIAIVMSVLNTISLVTVFYFQKPRADESNGDLITTSTTTLSPK